VIQRHAGVTDFSSEVLVVPCFMHRTPQSSPQAWPLEAAISGKCEKSGHCRQIRVDAKPLTMVDLLLGISSGRVFDPGPHHASTNYAQWLARDEDSFDSALRNASFASTYTMGWEPYIVISRQHWKGLNADGMFHKMFRAHGWDKASFIYEVAVRGYKFRTLRGAFLMHAAEAHMKCPEVFGPEFCAVAGKSSSDGWTHSQESRSAFASFIRLLSERLAESNLGDNLRSVGAVSFREVKMPEELVSGCLIFPFRLMRRLALSQIDDWLDQAYMALAQARSDLQARGISSNASSSEFKDGSSSLSLQSENGNPLREDWISQDWHSFASTWCVSVPALVGTVEQMGKSLVLLADTRVWEFSYKSSMRNSPSSFHTEASQQFRHYISGIKNLHTLERKNLGLTQMELSTESLLVDLCAETEKGSRLWLCTIHTHTFLEDDSTSNRTQRLVRDAILVEHEPEDVASSFTSSVATRQALVAEANHASEVFNKDSCLRELAEAKVALARERWLREAGMCTRCRRAPPCMAHANADNGSTRILELVS